MSAEPSPQSPWQAATITRIEKRTPRVTSFWFQPSRPFTH
ncbi:oxidoreductase, partial [bacterium M00.F.Ca.ET.168.01.1.1]